MGRLIWSSAICLYSFLDYQHHHQHPSSASSAFITHHCSPLLTIATATATATATTTTTTTGAHGLGVLHDIRQALEIRSRSVKDLTIQIFSDVAAAAAAAAAAVAAAAAAATAAAAAAAAAAEKSPEFVQNA